MKTRTSLLLSNNPSITKRTSKRRVFTKQLTSVEIAHEVLFRIKQHRMSWDSDLHEFTLGHIFQDRILPFLYEHSKYNALAYTLSKYDYQAPIEIVCEGIIKNKLK